MTMNLKYYLRGLGLGFIVAALVLGIHHFTAKDKTMTDAQIRERAVELGMVDKDTRLTEAEADVSAEELLESIDQNESDTAGDNRSGSDEVPADQGNENETADNPLIEDVTAEISTDSYDDPDAAMTTELPTAEEVGADIDKPAENTSEEANPSETGENGSVVAEGTETTAAEESGARTSSEADDTKINPDGGTIQVVSGDSSDRVARKLEEAGIIASASEFDRYLCSNGYDRRISTGTYTIPEGSSDQEIAKMITHSN